MSDIVERLKKGIPPFKFNDWDFDAAEELMEQAAARIEGMQDCLDYERGVKESLAAENSRLRARIEEMTNALEIAVSRGCDHCADSIRLSGWHFTSIPSRSQRRAPPAKRRGDQ